MTESKVAVNTTENADIIPLTDLAILTDKARRIMARERRKRARLFIRGHPFKRNLDQVRMSSMTSP